MQWTVHFRTPSEKAATYDTEDGWEMTQEDGCFVFSGQEANRVDGFVPVRHYYPRSAIQMIDERGKPETEPEAERSEVIDPLLPLLR